MDDMTEGSDAKLRTLNLEDVPSDSELIERELRREGIPLILLRVETRESFENALADFAPDIILADNKLPEFDGFSALEIAKVKCPDIPFIFVTGSMGEEWAIEAIKMGATDYVLKERLSKLAPAVRRAMAEAEEHIRRMAAEAELRLKGEQIAASEERLRRVVDAAPDAILILDDGCTILFANREAEQLFGKSKANLVGSDFGYPVVAGEVTDISVLSVKGVAKTAEMRAVDMVWEGKNARLLQIRDMTERAAAEEKIRKLYSCQYAIRNVNEELLRVKDETLLFQKVCDLLAAMEGVRFIWIGLKEEDYVVRPVAQAGFEEDYLSAIKVRWDESDLGRGPSGTAIRTGMPFVMADIENDPGYRPWREEALKRGYAASAALPLKCEDDVIGVLNVYSDRSDAFRDQELEFLSEVATDIAIGIKSLKTTERLRKSEERFRTIFEHIIDGLLIVDMETKRFVMGNTAICNMLGYGADELMSLTVGDIHPKEHLPYISSQLERQVRGEFSLLADVPVLRRDGTVFFADINAARIEFGDRICLTGVFRDTTDRKRAEEQLRQRLEELERFRDATIKREYRIKELRDRVKTLEAEVVRLRS